MLDTGIITAAGEGTRMHPYTAIGRKELAPVGKKPGVLRLVEDLSAAGISNIHFIVSPNDTRIQEFFDPTDISLARLDPGRRKERKEISGLANFNFHAQKPEFPGNGGAIASVNLPDANVPVACFWGDTLSSPGSFRHFIAAYNDLKDPALNLLYASLIAEDQMPDAVMRYGFIQGKDCGQGLVDVERIIEKPGLNGVPRALHTNLAVLTGYILRAGSLELLRNTPQDPKTGEMFLTHSLDGLDNKRAYVGPMPFDIGSPLGLALANHAYLTDQEKAAFNDNVVRGR